MKRIIKSIILCFLFIPFMNLSAVSSDLVNYKVKSIFINADVLSNGDLKVKELITLNGTFNGYERDILYTGNTNNFDGSRESFISSDIYNATNITGIKVGIITTVGLPTWSTLLNTPTLFEENIVKNKNDKFYTKTRIENGLRFRIYNETIESKTSFYIEYIVKDVIVKHNDYAELQYNFIGTYFDDKIENVEIRVNLPTISNYYKSWAHGPLSGNLKLENNISSILTVNDLNRNTFVDLRMLFDKDIVNVSKDKESNVYAEDKILDIEASLAEEANRLREIAKTKVLFVKISNFIFLISLVSALIYIYFKYDKEHNSIFKHKYNRNFNEEYNPEIVPYIFDKRIGNDSFNASILNLINKKNIKVEVIKGKKEKDNDYEFIKLNENNLNSSEIKLINILFRDGNNSVLLSDIKKYAKNTTSSGFNSFLNNVELWKKGVTKEAELLDIFEDSKTPFFIVGIFLIWFLINIFVTLSIEYFTSLTLLSGILLFVSFIYVALVKKRTRKGIEDYAKWKAFKNFLKDFSTFDKKELPEIYLWDKYLVYATALGMAAKVSKAMKMQIEAYYGKNDFEFTDIYISHMLYANLNSSINESFKVARESVAKVAASNMSSAVGSGGGFSSGGGGGTGGGGGRGF